MSTFGDSITPALPPTLRSPTPENKKISFGRTRSPSRDLGPDQSPDSSDSGHVVDKAQIDDEPTWPQQWTAYVSLAGCFFLMFNSWGLVNAYGTFSSFYKEDLLPGTDLLLLNLVGSTESFVVLVNSFWIGRLLDNGLSRYILFAGWILVSLGMFTLSLTAGNGAPGQGRYGLIWVTQGLTTGMGMACFFVSSSQIAATWFVKRKSFAIGIVASGASIAGLVYPFMIKFLIAQLGFPNAVRCVAGLVCGTALFSFLCAIPNPRHPLHKPEAPLLSVRRWIDTAAFKNSTFNWFAASIAFMFFGFYAVFFNIEEWAVKKELGTKNPDATEPGRNNTFHTFIYLAVMNASSTIGRLSSGYLSDHYGALNVHAVVMFTGAILLYVMWTLASTIAVALCFVILFGAVSGAIIGMPPASVANIINLSQGVDHRRLGQWTGMMYTIASPFALVGPVIAGHLITEYNNNYLTVQMWSATCLFGSFICLLGAIWNSKRRKLSLRRTLSSASSIRKIISRTDVTLDEEKSTAFSSENPSALSSRVFRNRDLDAEERNKSKKGEE